MGVQKLKSTIPENAKKVFDGVIFDVYQWEQEMFDGSFEMFEMLRRAGTVNIVAITPDNKIMLTKQQQPGSKVFIGNVGGRIDEGEGPEHAAHRELLEESGYKTDHLELWFSCQPVGKIDWGVYTFIARDIAKVQEQHLDTGEKIELFFVNFDEYIDIVTDKDYRDTEIALEIMRAKINGKMDEIKKLFSNNNEKN